jgi:hypothetical protein
LLHGQRWNLALDALIRIETIEAALPGPSAH